MVELVDINTKNPDRTIYSIKFLRVNTMIVIKELLNPRNVSDIGSIPIYSNYFISKSKNTT